MVVSVKQYPTGRKLFVELLVGTDMEQWVDQLERVLIECRDLVGAMCIEASCRIGLAKKLGKRGWSKKAIVMELT